jgi:hypothetical protein
MNRNLRILLASAFLVCWTIYASGQDNKKEGVERIKRKNWTYYWVGNLCPPTFKNTFDLYGFKIECSGCILTKKIDRNNKRIIKEVEKIFGQNWFKDNRNNFY